METVNKFGERLLKLREERNETQQQLADAIGITRQSLSRYETNERTPNIDLVYNVAKHYNVSSDYLLGISGIQSIDKRIETVCEVTGLSEKVINNITAFQKLQILPEIKDFWDNNMDDIIENDYFLGLYFNIANMYIASKEYVKSIINRANQKEITDKETIYKAEAFKCAETFRKLIDSLKSPLHERAEKYNNLTLLVGEDTDYLKPSESDWLNLKKLFDEELSKHGEHNHTKE